MPAYVETDENVKLEGDLVLDLSDVSDEPVAEGWHFVRIKKGVVKRTSEESKEPGILMLRVSAQIENEEDENNGEWLFFNAMLEGKWKKIAAGFWPAIGIELGEAHTFRSVGELINAVEDKTLMVLVRHKNDPERGVQAEVRAFATPELGATLNLETE